MRLLPRRTYHLITMETNNSYSTARTCHMSGYTTFSARQTNRQPVQPINGVVIPAPWMRIRVPHLLNHVHVKTHKAHVSA
jgi:hypothetical protein